MKVRLRLFLDWGIRFEKPYEAPERAQRPVAYASKQALERAITRRHQVKQSPASKKADEAAPVGESLTGHGKWQQNEHSGIRTEAEE